MNVASVLADIAPEGIAPSIQSPPLGFKARVTDGSVVEAYAENCLRVVAPLVVEARTGRTVTPRTGAGAALSQEADLKEAVAFFNEHVYTGRAAERLAKLSGLPVSSAHGALRRHLGVVFDPCHQSVEYEDMAGALGALRDAGVPVFKLQQAAAVRRCRGLPPEAVGCSALDSTPCT